MESRLLQRGNFLPDAAGVTPLYFVPLVIIDLQGGVTNAKSVFFRDIRALISLS
jgi:hypothetical protein